MFLRHDLCAPSTHKSPIYHDDFCKLWKYGVSITVQYIYWGLNDTHAIIKQEVFLHLYDLNNSKNCQHWGTVYLPFHMSIYSFKVQFDVISNTVTKTIFIDPLKIYDVQFNNILKENNIKCNIYSISSLLFLYLSWLNDTQEPYF